MEEWAEEASEQLDRVTGGAMADAWHGIVRIVSVSEPKGRRRYQACTMDITVEAPELPRESMTTEVVVDRRYWPRPGTALRALISRRTPRMLEVNWQALEQVAKANPQA